MFKFKNLKKRTLTYECKNVFITVLKRICKNSFIIIDMKNEINYIKTLKIFLKISFNDNNLEHVYYKHLY